MTDKEKLEAVRAEIHRLVDVRGYDREMANDLFAFMDSLPNEPVSEDLEEEIDNYVKRNGYDGLDSIEEIKYIAQYFTKWQKTKDDSCTSDLGDYISELSKQFPEVSFAKLSRIAVRVAKWQKEHLWKSVDGEDLPEIDREVIVLVDNFGKLIPKLAKRTYHLIENFVDEDTGEIISIENTDEVGDIINWTEPAIYWLDVDIPKLKETMID